MKPTLFVYKIKPGKLQKYLDMTNEWQNGSKQDEYKDLLMRYGLNNITLWHHNIDGEDYAMYSDGGFAPLPGATFAAQAKSFDDFDYSVSGRPVSNMFYSRFPRGYGWERSTVNTAELAGLVSALRWRRFSKWNMVVADRSSLFSVMLRMRNAPRSVKLNCACAPLELRPLLNFESAISLIVSTSYG